MKYKIYALVDPRNNKVCYIGCTYQNLNKRFLQHLNPIKTNQSKLAKLVRFLKNKSMKLSIIEIDNCSTKEEMYEKEIFHISDYKKRGYELKNIQDGGQININDKQSYLKFKKTHLNNKELHNYLKGEEARLSLLKNYEVLNIYELIKKGYNNEELYELYKDKCSLSAIKAIRAGQTWKTFYKINLNFKVVSIKNYDKNSYKSYQKLKIVDLIIKGYSIKHINKWFKKISISDLKRVQTKQIWQPVWKVHEQISAYNK